MKKLSIILIMSIIGVSGALAQTFGEIHGKVFDDKGETIPGVNVYVNVGDQTKGTVSDIDGKFKLKPLAAGVYLVKITMAGMQEVEIQDVKVSPDRITFLEDVKMAVQTEMLGPAVCLTHVIPLIDPDNTGMSTITAAEIKNQPEVKNLQSFVAKSFPGVTSNAEGTELYFRGSRAGTALYYVDGVKIMGRAPKIPQSGIGSINVYTGGVPAKYGDVTGGVIVIETKNYFDLYNQKKYSN